MKEQKIKLDNIGANLWAAFHLGGMPKDYQVNEDNVIFCQGKSIGVFKREMRSKKDGTISIDCYFCPDKKAEYITIKFKMDKGGLTWE